MLLQCRHCIYGLPLATILLICIDFAFGCRYDISMLGKNYVPMLYAPFYFGPYSPKIFKIFLPINGKLETLELQKPQEESPRADGQSAGDIVFGRLAGNPGSSAIGYFTEKSTEYWGYFVGQIQIPNTKSKDKIDTYYIDSSDAFFSAFEEFLLPTVHSIFFKLTDLKLAACNAIDNGGTDIGCENECPPPFPAPSTKDQEKAKQKPNTEKRNCAVRAIIDRQGAQRYYKRTLEGSGTVAIMPRHLDAFERMSKRNAKRHIAAIFAIANQLNTNSQLQLSYNTETEVYDDIECKKADNVGNLFCNLVEPPKNAQRDVEKREQQAHLYAFLAQISGNEYEKNSGSCITTVFTGRQYKYLQGAGTLGDRVPTRGACAKGDDRLQIRENTAVIKLFGNRDKYFPPLVENISTLLHEIGHLWGLLHDEDVGCQAGYIMTSESIVYFKESYLQYSECSKTTLKRILAADDQTCPKV